MPTDWLVLGCRSPSRWSRTCRTGSRAGPRRRTCPGRWSSAPGTGSPRRWAEALPYLAVGPAPVDAERGDQILVQLEPDPVAGVDVGPVHPVSLPRLGALQRGAEPLVVAGEPRQHGSQPADQMDQVVAECFELVQDAAVPGRVGVRSEEHTSELQSRGHLV